jgi:outer membrane lipoprotein carrier protein
MKSKVLFLTALMLLTSCVFADPGSDALIKMFSNINSISADFKQTVYNQNGSSLSVSTGSMLIARPDKFRWNMTSPMTQLSVGDGKKVWTYQPDLEQVSVNPMTAQIGQTPLAILSGSVSALTQYFTIQATSNQTFKLMAKDTNAPFSEVDLKFNGNTISSMTLFDSLDQKTVLSFSNVKNNLIIPANQFTFVVPQGVDVVNNGN